MKELTTLQKEARKIKREKRKADKAVGTLKKTIMYTAIGHLSYQQWVRYRKEYIGGSDVSAMLGLNPYQSKIELFHEKVGVISKIGKESEATYSGHTLEQHVIDKYWVYYDINDPDPLTTISNAVANKKLRYARKLKDNMMYDPRFPFIQMNVDGLIQNTRHEKAPRGILEIKTGLQRVWDTYEAGIPVFYILQVQTYLLVTGLKYAEIAVLLDGRFFKVFPIWASVEIQQKILSEAKLFWDLVLEGRMIWDDKSISESERLQYLSQIEPAADGSNSLDKYLKERFRSNYKVGQLQATTEIIETAQKYLKAGGNTTKWEGIKKQFGSTLRNIFINNQVDEIIDEDEKVIISYRKSGEKAPQLRVKKSINDIDL